LNSGEAGSQKPRATYKQKFPAHGSGSLKNPGNSGSQLWLLSTGTKKPIFLNGCVKSANDFAHKNTKYRHIFSWILILEFFFC
jgi:hypothetical protein